MQAQRIKVTSPRLYRYDRAASTLRSWSSEAHVLLLQKFDGGKGP